jgi:hypothetical protein
MYPVGTGSAALQRRVRRGQTSAKAAEVEDLSGFRFSSCPYYAGLKARTTRTGGYPNCGIALDSELLKRSWRWKETARSLAG